MRTLRILFLLITAATLRAQITYDTVTGSVAQISAAIPLNGRVQIKGPNLTGNLNGNIVLRSAIETNLTRGALNVRLVPNRYTLTFLDTGDFLQFSTVGDGGTYNVIDLATNTTLQLSTNTGPFQRTSEKGQTNGYAPLGSDGLVPEIYLPAGTGGSSTGGVTSAQSTNTARFFSTNAAWITSNAIFMTLTNYDAISSNALFALITGTNFTLVSTFGTVNATNLAIDNFFLGSLTLSNVQPGIAYFSTAATNLTNVANGTGMLTNDGSGVFGWMSIPSGGGGATLSDVTAASNGAVAFTMTASNTIRSFAGESNVLGEISVTNATMFGLVSTKSGVTNRTRSIAARNGLVATNESGTNISLAIDPAIVFSQTQATALSNAAVAFTMTASNTVRTFAGESNVLGEISVTNATTFGLVSTKSGVTNRTRSIAARNGLVGTNESGTNISLAIDPAIVASQTDLLSISNAVYWSTNYGLINVATNGSANSNLLWYSGVISNKTLIYLTNNLSLTNFATLTDNTTEGHLEIVPQLIPRTLVLPTLGTPQFGVLLETNFNGAGPIITSLTNGRKYVLGWNRKSTNIAVRMIVK